MSVSVPVGAPGRPAGEGGASEALRATGTSARRRSAVLLPAMVLVAGCAAAVALHVQAYTAFSPVDELQHYDYLERTADGELLRRGTFVRFRSMREMACRGLDAAQPLPKCSARKLHPYEFPQAGYNTADIHPPLYYAISANVRRVLGPLTGSDGLPAARAAGILWLSGGAVLTWWLMRLFSVGPWTAAAVAGIAALSPSVLHATATVNPDATTLVAGAGVAVACVLWERRRLAIGWLIVAAALAVLLKPTNLVGVIAAALYLAFRAWAGRREPEDGEGRDRRALAYVMAIVALALGVVVASVGWSLVREGIAVAGDDKSPFNQQFHVDSIGLDHLAENVGVGAPPLRAPYLPAFLDDPAVHALVEVQVLLLLAAVPGALLWAARREGERALAVGALGAMLAVGPVYVVANYVFSSAYVRIPDRYALSALPMVMCVLGMAAGRTRAMAWVVRGVALLSAAVVGTELILR